MEWYKAHEPLDIFEVNENEKRWKEHMYIEHDV